MLGAVAGDIIGSVYEGIPHKSTEFPLFQEKSRFTDDTVLTLAVAQAIMKGEDYGSSLKVFGRAFPHAGYGGHFRQWIYEDQVRPYHSWGNGSAMRVSPVGLAFDQVETVLEEAQKSAQVSHNHREGIKGAQATALAVFLARDGKNKSEIRKQITRRFGYDLNRRVEDIRPSYSFEVSCQRSVPEALICFLEARDFEDAVRLAVSLGGDSDTLACIAGAVAQAYFGELSPVIIREARARLPDRLRQVMDRFQKSYPLNTSSPAPLNQHRHKSSSG